jgi:hypothetical protein
MTAKAVQKQQQHAEASSARTVVVACKIPNGLTLQLQRPFEKWEDERDGPRKRTYNVFYGKRYIVRGPAYPVGTLPKGFAQAKPTPMLEGGYALTRGIPKDFWEQWLAQNKEAEFVIAPEGAEHGMIFAYDDIDDVAAAAREQERLLSGHEPVSTEEDAQGRLTDRRVPKPMTGGLSQVSEEKRT